eukprot:gene5213-21015_t
MACAYRPHLGFKGSDTIQKAVSGYVSQGVWLSNYKSEYTAQLKQRFEYVDRKNATFAYTDSSYTIPVLTFIEAVYSSTGKCQGVTFPANTVFKLTVPNRTSGDGGKECSNGEALGVECRSANDSPTCIAVSTSVAWHEACPYTCAICTHSNDIISKFWNKWSTTTTTTFPSATSEQLSPSDSGSGSEPLSPPVSGPFSGSFYGSGPFSGSFYGSGFFSGSGPFSPQPTPDNDKLIRINASTGAIQVDPLPSGTYTGLQVVATLPSGKVINLTDSWNLTVIPRPAFSVTWKYDRDPIPPAVLNAEYKYNAGKDYIVSEQVDVKENNKIFNILDGASSIIYRTAGGSRKLPPGLKLDLGSGRIYGAPIKAGVFHVDILAEDLDNEGYKVKVHRGNAQPKVIHSVDIVVNECTNDVTCNNHGKCDHLEDLYDGISTCRCNFGYAGLACETPTLAYYIVAILFGLGGVPAAIYVYKLRKRAMAPVDFEAKLQELIDAGDIEVPTDDQEHHQQLPKTGLSGKRPLAVKTKLEIAAGILVAHGHFLSTAVDVTGPAAPAASACPPKIEYLKALAPITSGVGLGHQTAAIAPRQVQIDTSGGKSVGLYLNDRPNGRGLVVRGCIPGGQAEKTGQIFSNDVVTHVNGTDITGMTMAEVGPLIATTTTPTFTLVAPEGVSNLSAGWECKSTPEGSKNDAGVEYKESQSSMYQRVVTDGADQSDASSAAFLKQALLSTPLLSLHEACKLATVHCQQDLQKEATAALEFALALLQSPTLGPKYAALGFSVVDVAVVHVYTQETELYPCMNGALGGWGKPDPDGMRGLTHYMGIIKLLFNALEKLPPMSGEEVFRGVRNVKLDVLLKGKGVGDVLIWGAFTSTSVDADTLHDPVFFGFEPGLGERVIFHIRNETGVRIQELSEKGCLFGYADEDEEEVLLKPGSKFVIDAITSLADDITQVQMHEVVEDEEHLELKKKKKKTKNGAFVTRSPSGNDIGGATNTAATWSCAACTFDNTAIATACAMCDTPKVASIPNQLQSSGLNPASAADDYTAADAASSTAATTALTYTQGLVEGSAYASASPSASTTDFNDYQLCMYQRVLIPEVDQSDEDGVALLRNSLPDTPLVSLHEACRRASVHCVSSLQREATAALEFASALLESPVAGPKYAALGLTVVDVAVVNLYTQETPLYLFMNGALGGWGRDGKQGIMHYMCIIKLLFNAIKKLTPLSGETVFRGVYNVTLDVLLNGNGVGDTLVWGAFTSTSVDADTLHEFINIEPGLAGCVVFHIKNETGVRIQELSNKGSFFGYADEDEEEVLLKPGSAFVIDAINSLSSNLPHVPSNGNASSSIGLVNMTHAVGSGYVAGLQEFGGYYDDVDDGYEGIGRITSETTLL